MRLAVCEAPAVLAPDGEEWRPLAEEARAVEADVFLLNEMPFGRWLASAPEPDRDALLESHRLHDAGLARLGELGALVVLGTRPAFEGGRSVNQAFAWEARTGPRPAHTKQFLPDEEGYHEARWFERGETHFRPVPLGVGRPGEPRAGFLVCTEVWFSEWARWYGRAGAHLIAVPRATPAGSTDRWRTAVRMAAMVSGCYAASSNRSGTDDRGQAFGGRGWIVDPSGEVVAETSASEPVVAAELDLERVATARGDYPCYVEDLH